MLIQYRLQTKDFISVETRTTNKYQFTVYLLAKKQYNSLHRKEWVQYASVLYCCKQKNVFLLKQGIDLPLEASGFSKGNSHQSEQQEDPHVGSEVDSDAPQHL